MRSDAGPNLRERLLAANLLIETGVEGLYGRSEAFERIVEGFDRFVSRAGLTDAAEVVRFPPLLPRSDLRRSGYVTSFPHLAGTVHSFAGGTREHADLLARVESGDEWADDFAPTAVALTPAACYPVYPMSAGTLPEGGRLFDVQSYCFRHEPSLDPARMQAFRMREYVCLGTPEAVREFRDRWLARASELMETLGLRVKAVVANDPFFGKRGVMLASSQREQALKFELVATISDAQQPTALISCNYHRDHLAGAFGIRSASGQVAHTACVGFGLERIALALLAEHGIRLADWPRAIRTQLEIAAP